MGPMLQEELKKVGDRLGLGTIEMAKAGEKRKAANERLDPREPKRPKVPGRQTVVIY